DYKMHPMGMFELAPVGIPVAIVGLLYMFTIGMKLIPDRTENKTLEEAYNLREYLTEVMVLPESTLAGKTIAQSEAATVLNLQIVGVIRNDKKIIAPRTKEQIQGGDVLLVEGTAEEIVKIKDVAGLEIKADFK